MASRRHSNARRSAPRRRLFWARQTGLRNLTPNNQATHLDLLYDFQQIYGADLFGITVTRIVGHYTYYSTENAAVSTTYNFSVGIRVDGQSHWTSDVPDEDQVEQIPINNPLEDWMYVRNNLGIVGGAGDDTEVAQAAANRVEVDLRAQRRVDEVGQTLMLFAGTANPLDDSIYCWFDLNILCKRP